MKQQEQASGGAPELVHDEAQQCYQLRQDGEVAAVAQYRKEGDAVCFVHTEVDQRYEGQGLGSRIAAFALDDVKTRGLKAKPACPFIAAYIQRHEEEYGELVT